MLVKNLESLLDRKEIKPVNPKGKISPEYSLEGLMLKLKLQYFDHLMRRSDSLEKIGWHHLFDGHEFDKALGVGEGQRNLVCCSTWGHKALDII